MLTLDTSHRATLRGHFIKEDIAKAISQQKAAALDGAEGCSRYGGYIGLHVHKDTIAVAIAMVGRDEPVYRGEIVEGVGPSQLINL